MKILHTADWHLGKKLETHARLPEQIEVLNEICEIADKEAADVVIVAGDLYDTFNPTNEAITLFYKTLKRISKNGERPVIAIAGNHDSPDRIEAPDPLARECGIILLGYPHSMVSPFRLDTGLEVTKSEPGFLELKVPGQATPLRLILTPYANELRLKTYLGLSDREENLRDLLQQKWQHLADAHCDDQGINMMVAHLFMMKKGEAQPLEDDSEKSILHIGGAQAIYTEQVPKQLQYVALGHLHRYQNISGGPCPVVYSSSPLAYSFAEANQTKYVVLVEAEAGKEVKLTPTELQKGKKLLRGRFESIDKALDWLKENPNALIEITIVTDHYLTAKERKSLNEQHPGIIAIIPEVKTKTSSLSDKAASIDTSKHIDDLFRDYFKSRNNEQEPNERLMDLFREVRSK
ncbi:MAG TPA: exonuclease sbcCD subunit D [Microscillaceae bacterium]|nr:exonuclease sbcCD subunit D [Microscillaceae bacterium]